MFGKSKKSKRRREPSDYELREILESAKVFSHPSIALGVTYEGKGLFKISYMCRHIEMYSDPSSLQYVEGVISKLKHFFPDFDYVIQN